MRVDPQQELFSKLLMQLKDKGYDVYDGFLPPEGTQYPFVYMADSTQTDTANKTALFGSVYQTIHVWHNNPMQRGLVSAMLLEAKTICRNINKTANFNWSLRSVDQRILPDNTTKQPLLHGVLELHFDFD